MFSHGIYSYVVGRRIYFELTLERLGFLLGCPWFTLANTSVLSLDSWIHPMANPQDITGFVAQMP